MVIEFLGVGSGLSPALGNNNVLLTSETSDRQVLIDCGFSTPPELSGRSQINKITDILITHVHSDHIGGLELMGFTYFYVLRHSPDAKKITLHFPNEKIKDDTWHCLERQMESAQTAEDGTFTATFDTYFDISIGETPSIEGFDSLKFQKTEHVENMDAYSVWLNKKTYYSSDTVKLPPANAELIFQDCQLFDSPTSVHTSFTVLNGGMDKKTKEKTWLMHYGFNANGVIPEDHGFKGFVKRFQKFEF